MRIGAAALATFSMVAACSPATEPATVDPAALPPHSAGETDQGLRVTATYADGRITIHVPVDCESRDVHEPEATSTGPLPSDGRGYVAAVDADGTFDVERSYVLDGTDGNEMYIDAAVSGTVDEDGVRGRVEGVMQMYNAQAEAVDRTCTADPLSWSAVPIPVNLQSFTHTGDALWTTTVSPGDEPRFFLERRDPVTGASVARVEASGGQVVVNDDGIWLVHGGVISGYDPETLVATRTIRWSGHPVHERAASASSIWLTREGLTHIDTRTGRETTVLTDGAQLAVGPTTPGQLWVAQDRQRVLRRLDGGAVVETVDVGTAPHDPAVDATGDVWFATGTKGEVLRHEP